MLCNRANCERNIERLSSAEIYAGLRVDFGRNCKYLYKCISAVLGISMLWIVNACAQSMLWSSVLASVVAIYEKDKVKKKSSAMVRL